MLKKYLEQLFEFVAQHIPSDEIMKAKKEYQKATGEIYEDDKSYNSRMALFLEWYLLDQYSTENQKTVLENIIEENPTSLAPGYLEIYKDIANNIQGLFEVKKVRDNSVTVLNLFTDEKHIVDEEDSKLGFRKNDIFQGRIVFHQGKLFFSGYFCFHPEKTQKYIKSETKKFYLIQKGWNKELDKLGNNLLKIQKSLLKNSKYIEKIKGKISDTDISARLEKLNNDLLELENERSRIETNIQLIEDQIANLKHDSIKIEGRKLISDLLNKLAYMNLKWERSRQIEILDIYKN